jgi:hypothetical protein
VKYWEDCGQLVNDIKDSIHGIERRRPGVGWIRGDQALDPKVYKDLEDERRQNKELREKLEGIGKAEIVFPSHLEHGSDIFEIEYSVTHGMSADPTKAQTLKISWEELFIELGETGEHTIRGGLLKIIARKQIINSGNIQIRDSYIEQIGYQFEAWLPV